MPEPRVYEIEDEQGRVYEVEMPAPGTPSLATAPAPPPKQTGSLEALGRGLGQGATLGWGDEAAAWLEDKLAADQPERYPEGDRQEHILARIRGNNEQARKAHGGLYGAGELVGGAATGISLAAAAPALAPSAGMLPMMAAGAAEGALIGGATGAGMADEGTRLEGAQQGALYGGVAGGAAPAVAGAVGAGAQSIARGAKRVADRSRAGATGAYGGQLKKLARDKGPDAVEEFGADVERLGMHEGAGSPLPQSWETYAENASKLKAQSGARIGELSELADQSGVTVKLGDVAKDLMDEAMELSKIPDAAARQQADELMARAANFEGRNVSYSEAHALRKFLDKQAYNAEAALQTQVAERARKVAGKLRGKMDDAMREADPALRDAMADANLTYGTAARVSTYAEMRLAQESGNQAMSLPSMVSGAGGYAGGGPVGAAMGATGGQLMKTRGHSAMAGGARAVQRGAERTASAAAGAGRGGGALAAVTAQHDEPVDTASLVRKLTRTNPERLGEYGAILADADSKGNFATAHSILQQTDPDYQQRLRDIEAEEY